MKITGSLRPDRQRQQRCEVRQRLQDAAKEAVRKPPDTEDGTATERASKLRSRIPALLMISICMMMTTKGPPEGGRPHPRPGPRMWRPQSRCCGSLGLHARTPLPDRAIATPIRVARARLAHADEECHSVEHAGPRRAPTARIRSNIAYGATDTRSLDSRRAFTMTQTD